MKEKRVITTLRPLYEYIEEQYAKYHAAPIFHVALRHLLDEGRLVAPSGESPFHYGMTQEEFDNYILDRPYDVTNIVNAGTTPDTNVSEGDFIPVGRDVLCYRYIDYSANTLHSHQYFEINYVYSGNCRLVFEDKVIPMETGDMYIVAPGLRHNDIHEPGSFMLGIAIRSSTFSSIFSRILEGKDLFAEFFRTALYSKDKIKYLILKTGDFQHIRNIIQELFMETELDDTYSNISSSCLLEFLLAQVFRMNEHTAVIAAPENASRSDHDFIMILQYLQQNYNTVTLSELSERFHYSESHMCRLIKQNLNQSFTAIIRNLRMGEAERSLLGTDLKISDIALKVGYDSVDHFSRTFQKEYGKAPSEYRKLHAII